MPNNFNIISPLYQIGELLFFGDLLQESRIQFRDNLTSPKSVLLLGEGRGNFLKFLLSLNKKCLVTVVESSSVMIRYQKSIIPKKDMDRVYFKNIPLEKFRSNIEFDLVCSFYFWDCFNSREINLLLPNVVKFLSDRGYWMNADFVDVKFKDNKINFLKLRIMYFLFKIFTGISASKVVSFRRHAVTTSLHLIDSKEIQANFIRSELFQKII